MFTCTMSRIPKIISAIIISMILVSGATGFIGRVLIRQLTENGYPVKVLLRPSPRTPRLPKGVPVEVAVVSLADTRGLRAAMSDVDTVFHLASAESQGRNANLFATDIQGSENLANAAADAGVKRFVFLSHIGAARASGYPVFKAKGIAEENIKRSGVPYTILRSSLVFGPEDHFTTTLARLLRAMPFIFPVPSGGRTVLQPLWVEDLVTCMLWSLEKPETINQTIEIGGIEYFTLREIIETIMTVTKKRRYLLTLSPITLRALTVTLESSIPNYSVSSFWLDYLAVNRTCSVDSMSRIFNLMPARFSYRLEYLIRKPWYGRILDSVRTRSGPLLSRIQKSLRSRFAR